VGADSNSFYHLNRWFYQLYVEDDLGMSYDQWAMRSDRRSLLDDLELQRLRGLGSTTGAQLMAAVRLHGKS